MEKEQKSFHIVSLFLQRKKNKKWKPFYFTSGIFWKQQTTQVSYHNMSYIWRAVWFLKSCVNIKRTKRNDGY